MTDILADIAAERARQIAKGYTTEHDALHHGTAELECVAAYLINPDASADAPADWAARIKAKWGGNAYRLDIIAAALLVAAAELRRSHGWASVTEEMRQTLHTMETSSPHPATRAIELKSGIDRSISVASSLLRKIASRDTEEAANYEAVSAMVFSSIPSLLPYAADPEGCITIQPALLLLHDAVHQSVERRYNAWWESDFRRRFYAAIDTTTRARMELRARLGIVDKVGPVNGE